jgi:hypothetical protein
MTDTETAGTAVAQQVAEAALARMQDAKPWTVADLAKILAGPAPEIAQDAPFPAAPPKVNITAGLKAALKKLPSVFGVVTPTEHRKLEQDELKRLTEEVVTIETIKTQLGDRLEAAKEAVRHHLDFLAVEGAADGQELLRVAEGVAKGHVIIAKKNAPYKLHVEGAEDPWEQRYVAGKAAVNGSRIPGLEKDGVITHAEALACTREVRVFDEDKLAALIRKNPERGVDILRLLTSVSAPSASLYAPKK